MGQWVRLGRVAFYCGLHEQIPGVMVRQKPMREIVRKNSAWRKQKSTTDLLPDELANNAQGRVRTPPFFGDGGDRVGNRRRISIFQLAAEGGLLCKKQFWLLRPRPLESIFARVKLSQALSSIPVLKAVP